MSERELDGRRAWQAVSALFFSDQMHDRFHSACAAVELPHPGALKLLLMLERHDSPSMSDLARALNCDASYVTGLVDTLEDRAYVARAVSPIDRRVKLVELTAAGRDAAAAAMAMLSTPPKEMERLSDHQTRTLARLLEILTAADPAQR